MNSKFFIISFVLFNYSTSYGMLRRTPKVYNALITTDDNLTPSRAFPVIQPTIHETGIAHLPFGPYNPYQFYSSPVIHQGDPQIYPLQQNFNPQFQQGFPPQFLPQGQAPIVYAPQQGLEKPLPIDYNIPDKQLEPPHRQSNQNSNNMNLQPNNQMNNSKQDQMPVLPIYNNKPIQPQQQLPITLNEFGLPPGLIPLHALPSQRPDFPVNLQPYPYNNYPLIFDGHFPQQQPQQHIPPDHLLPHYGYVPQYPFGLRQPSRPYKKRRPSSSSSSTTTKRPSNGNGKELDLDSEQPQYTSAEENQSSHQFTSLGSILNGNENKNNDVPDVPPPPIPNGAKNFEENNA